MNNNLTINNLLKDCPLIKLNNDRQQCFNKQLGMTLKNLVEELKPQVLHPTNPYLASLLPISLHVLLKYDASVAYSARRYPFKIYNSCVKHFIWHVLKINNLNLFLNISLTPETVCVCVYVCVHMCVCGLSMSLFS